MSVAANIAEPAAEGAPARRKEDRLTIVRFDGHQRAQHFIMMSSVLVLVFTGMPQKFSDFAVSHWMIGFWGGLDNARFLHRVAGIAMLFSGLYHLAYISWIVLVRRQALPISMVPTPRDVMDFFRSVGSNVGLVRERPKFGRFNFLEKFDYWAVFWGVPIMGATGLILMFPLIATKWLGGVSIPVCTIAHSDEALLASGWLFVVHFYNVHFAPHVFPFSPTIFTGRMDAHKHAEEHPLETL